MKKIKILRKIANKLDTTDEQKKSIFNELKRRYKAMNTKQRSELTEAVVEKIVLLIQPQIDLEKRMTKEIQEKYLAIKNKKNEKGTLKARQK